jgi:hypothetical protein
MRSVVCLLSLLMPFASGSPVFAVDFQSNSGLDVTRLDKNVASYVASTSTVTSAIAQPASYRVEDTITAAFAHNVAAPSLTIGMGTAFASQPDLRHAPSLRHDTSVEKAFQLPALSDERLFDYLVLPGSSPMVVPADPAGQAPQFLDTIESMLSSPAPATDSMSLRESIPLETPRNQFSPW